MGFNDLLLKRLEKVNTEVGLMALAYNKTTAQVKTTVGRHNSFVPSLKFFYKLPDIFSFYYIAHKTPIEKFN